MGRNAMIYPIVMILAVPGCSADRHTTTPEQSTVPSTMTSSTTVDIPATDTTTTTILSLPSTSDSRSYSPAVGDNYDGVTTSDFFDAFPHTLAGIALTKKFIVEDKPHSAAAYNGPDTYIYVVEYFPKPDGTRRVVKPGYSARLLEGRMQKATSVDPKVNNHSDYDVFYASAASTRRKRTCRSA